MNAITRKQLVDQLKWRSATKQFDPSRKISAEDWDALEEALVLTPSGAGTQPWKFLVIDDPDLRARLQPVSYGQSQIVDASHLVVFAAKTNYNEEDVNRYIRRTAEVRGVSTEELAPFREMALNVIVKGKNDEERREWAFNQTYIALGNLLTSAALLGIDVCPMEGFSREEYDKILGLPELGVGSVVVATLGYRSPADKYASTPKVRFERKDVLAHL